MLMKNWVTTPMTAAHRKPRPAWEVMYGQRMNSPEASPIPAAITPGPSTLRRDRAGGMSL
jgi:hypothetical protein